MKRLMSYIAAVILFVANSYAITIDEVIDSIKKNNVALKISHEGYLGAKKEISSTNNLSNPEMGFEYHKGANVEGDKYGFAITQKFDWPGLYISRSKSNDSKISAEYANHLNTQLGILLDAKQLCMQVVNLNKKIETQGEIYDNISQLYTEYEKAAKQGEVSILDINKLKIELLNVKNDLDVYVAELESVKAALCGINGDNEISNILCLNEYPTQDLESIEFYMSQITSLDPEYIAKSEGVKVARGDYSVAKNGWFPEFALGYRYTNELGTKFNGFEVGMSLPIFANNKKVGASKSNLLVAEMAKNDILIKKEADLKAEYLQIVSTRTQIYNYKSVLEENNEMYLKKALDGGELSLLNYLLELRYFLEAKHTLLDLEYKYNTLLTSLNKYSLIK